MDSMYTSKLHNLQKAHTKVLKGKEKKGIAKYLVEDDDSDSNGSVNSDDDGKDDLSGGQYLGAKSIMQTTEDHPSKLIDLELLNVLKFCQELYQGYKENNDDYQEEIMMKSIELGKKNKQKVLVLDMDETMVSARFANRLPPGFVKTFEVDF